MHTNFRSTLKSFQYVRENLIKYCYFKRKIITKLVKYDKNIYLTQNSHLLCVYDRMSRAELIFPVYLHLQYMFSNNNYKQMHIYKHTQNVT